MQDIAGLQGMQHKASASAHAVDKDKCDIYGKNSSGVVDLASRLQVKALSKKVILRAGDLKSEEGLKLIEEYHARYVEGLKAIWNEHKNKCAPNRRRSLEIVQ
jgi:hypothetical protein